MPLPKSIVTTLRTAPAAKPGAAAGGTPAPRVRLPVPGAGTQLARVEPPTGSEKEHAGGGGGSGPGPWDRFCGRAVQRWPLVLGVGLLLAVPAAIYGYSHGERIYTADLRVDLEPRTIASGSPEGGAVPAEAIAVSELLQREAGLLNDVAEDTGAELAVGSRPPFGLLATVPGPSPEAAAAQAEAIRQAYAAQTRLKKPFEVVDERQAAEEVGRQLDADRQRLTEVNIELSQALARLESGGDPADLAAEEARRLGLARAAEGEASRARATGRDPLVFLAALLRAEAPVREAMTSGVSAAAGAMTAGFEGRGVVDPLRDAAAAIASVIAAVDDHRLVADGPVDRRFVRLSELDAAAAAVAAEARAAGSAAEVARVERSTLQALRWKKERIQGELENGIRAAERIRAQTPAAATLAAVEVAYVSATPTEDTRPLEALFGGLLGGLLGMLGALGWIAIDDRVQRADERPWAARGVTVLGTVPRVASAAENQTAGPASEASMERARGEAAALAEAVHAVRAMLEGRAGRTPGTSDAPGGRAFTVTSSGPGSGKTGLCLGLAASLASAGERVLLVDAAWTDRPAAEAGEAGEAGAPDERQTLEAAAMRMGYLHPEDHDLLAHPDADDPIGLQAFLAGESLEDAAFGTRIPGLSLLPAGPGPLDASRLSGRHVRRLIEAARPLHDVTLIDTSAVSVGLDALFTAAASDGVVLVVSAGERQAAVDRVLARLRASGATVLGTVLNRVGRPDPRHTAAAGAAALESGWQDQGSGMFAAAVGSPAPPRAGHRPRAAAPADAPLDEAEPPRALLGSDGGRPNPAPRPAEVRPPRDGNPEADDDDFNASDVLAGLGADTDEDAALPPAAPSPEEPDLDTLTEELAERIASGATEESGGTPDPGKDEHTPPASGGGSSPDAAADRESAPAVAPRDDDDEDAALDRLVDRHINASLPGGGPRNGRRMEDPPRLHRG